MVEFKFDDEKIFKLLEKRAGRECTKTEKAHIRFMLDSDEHQIPDFIGFPNMESLQKALEKFDDE